MPFKDANQVEMRESLLSILKDVSPNEDNYFISNLGTSDPAMNTIHEWNLYYAARPTSVTAKAEGAETVYPDLPFETRSNNRTAILEEPVKLSRTRKSIAMVTGADALTVEKERALARLKAQMEWNTINGAYASGISGTARGMAGIDGMISTLVTARGTNISFTEAELNDIVQDSYDQVGYDYVMNMLVAPAVIKRRVAGFGTNVTRNINASEKRLTSEVRVYDSELGPSIMIIAHKDVRKIATSLTVYGLNDNLLEYSYLVGTGEPHWEDRAVTGDNTPGTYITEFTLVNYQERGMVKRQGYSHTL
jgi:hypothetical protein